MESITKDVENNRLDATAVLYKKHKTAVYTLARVITKNKDLAEDVVQETFLNIHEQSTVYRSQGKEKAWVLGVAKNIAKQQVEKNRHCLCIEDCDEWELQEKENFEDVIEQEAQIKELLDVLTSKERDIVILHVLGGIRLNNIAGLLEIPLGSVYWYYSNALKKMKKHLLEQRN